MTWIALAARVESQWPLTGCRGPYQLAFATFCTIPIAAFETITNISKKSFSTKEVPCSCQRREIDIVLLCKVLL